jgi:hypothetical protein
MNYPKRIFCGPWKTGHCQGIAVDRAHGFIYYSFTTCLVKADFSGRVIGSVGGLLGHLGCIDFHEADGRVYGSLEYKNDEIGRGILSRVNPSASIRNAFYIALFDVDKIDRMNMDASKDGVMRAVYLKDVVDDYLAPGHRYGCSGIDGTGFGPMFGCAPDSTEYLFVAYGIYSDVNRKDNDHQILLAYDVRGWDELAQPLLQEAPHCSGPEAPLARLYAYTGNTTYGVQNLEYDAFTRQWFMAVYPGKKSDFANPSLFALDAAKAPELRPLKGLDQFGLCLSLSGNGLEGWAFPWGATGLCALGDGYYLISHEQSGPAGDASEVFLYRYDGKTPFEEV